MRQRSLARPLQVASKGHGNIALLNFVVSVCVSLGTQLPAFWWMKKIQAVTNETCEFALAVSVGYSSASYCETPR